MAKKQKAEGELLRNILSRVVDKNGVMAEREKLMAEQASFKAFLQADPSQNRFPHLVLYDATRMILSVDTLSQNNYIHASYVKGYKQPGGYVLTQLPNEETDLDFWRMIWQTKSLLIVVLSGFNEIEDRKAIEPFWPAVGQKSQIRGGAAQITTVKCVKGTNYDTYSLKLETKEDWKKPHAVTLIQYTKWSTIGAPKFLPEVVADVRVTYERLSMSASPRPPLVVCCLSGVHQSGTFVALDISQRRFVDKKHVNIMETVRMLRKQRFGCVKSFDHYLSLYEAMVNFVCAHCPLEEAARMPNLADFQLMLKETIKTISIPTSHR